MNKKFLVFNIIILLCLLTFAIFCILRFFDSAQLLYSVIREGHFDLSCYNKQDPFGLAFTVTINNFMFYFTSILVSCFAIFKTVSNRLMFFSIKFTYEEYKVMMDKRKAENQEKKKQKLQQKLNDLDKTE